MPVEWFEADVDADQLSRLVDYDHHWFPLDGRSAVLITYLIRPRVAVDPDPTVLAVHHGAADRHPALPDRLLVLVDQLRWRTTSPPG